MRRTIEAIGLAIAIAATGSALAQAPAAPSSNQATSAAAQPAAPATGDRWPKSADLGGATYTVYQPQLDSWDMSNLAAHAAVSVLPPGSQTPVFGVLKLTARTEVDRLARTVYFKDTTVENATFPSQPTWEINYLRAFQSLFVKGPFTVSLDRMEAALAILNAQNQAKSVAVRNPVPQFVFSPMPAVLVTIDGDPAWRPVSGTPYQRVLNARPLLLRDGSGTIYFHLFDGFLKAPGLAGPWSLAADVPSGIAKAASALAASGAVDLMEGPADEKTGKKPSLATGAPGVIVVTKPTELIVTDGKPELETLEATDLLYVKNTDANVFVALADQQVYVLVSGRWFRGPAGFKGPWEYVAGADLPNSFKHIPDNSPKENVKASVPGTPQAKEALITTQIPQTAQVDRAKATFAPQLAGTPELKPIEGTQLKYVANSSVPLIQVPGGTWFALQKAVWFTAPKLQGPWLVAASVPSEIYSIPPSSPLYYVTYAKVYDSTPTTVTVGYLPGYMGSYVADGTVVYGTGYDYAPYIGTSVWYGAPVTYGYAAGIAWTPWTGWGYGFGMGWAYGAAWGAAAWGWGAAPYWGAYAGAAWGANGAYGAWGPGGWAASSGNVYHQWGNTSAVTHSSAGYNAWTGNAWSGQAGHSYNSQTGQISAGQRGTVSNVYSGNYASGTRGATYNPTTGVSASGARGTVGNAYTGQSTNVARANVSGPGGNEVRAATVGNDHYADVNGNVYKNTGSGWEQHNSNGSWSSASSEGSRSMESEQEARDTGERRSSASSYGGGDRSYGEGFRSSGSEPESHGGFQRGGGGYGGGGGFRGGGGRRR
ncbi:MAG TPA: autotransporter [Burkholderiaceae bacterium]|nr:autotransporter [Burkholderiaceae bacterium]HQR70805.1 autotransporter [Burkholderiaceae bacterium]